tara:strand:- start:7492 stop:7626 length:135 start_codon:yes stop_codon:yes gene_type:complete
MTIKSKAALCILVEYKTLEEKYQKLNIKRRKQKERTKRIGDNHE